MLLHNLQACEVGRVSHAWNPSLILTRQRFLQQAWLLLSSYTTRQSPSLTLRSQQNVLRKILLTLVNDITVADIILSISFIGWIPYTVSTGARDQLAFKNHWCVILQQGIKGLMQGHTQNMFYYHTSNSEWEENVPTVNIL